MAAEMAAAMAAAMDEGATLADACTSIGCADEGMEEWLKTLSMMPLFFSGAMLEVLCGYWTENNGVF